MSDLEAAANLLKAFAHPLRLAIVLEVRDGPRCVHELVSTFSAQQSLVSQHLRILKQAGVLRGQRRGKEIAYGIVDEHIIHIALDAITHATEGRST